MIHKLWKIVTGLTVLGLAIAGLNGLIFGNGTLLVVPVGRSGVELIVDGKKVPMERSGASHFSAEVARGPHTVQVTDKASGTSATYTVDIATSFSKLLLPVRSDQCFVLFDVSHSAYSYSSGLASSSAATIVERYPNTNQPIEFPSHTFSMSTYVSLSGIPPRRRSSETVLLMRDLPCSMLDHSPGVALSANVHELYPPLSPSSSTPSASGSHP